MIGSLKPGNIAGVGVTIHLTHSLPIAYIVLINYLAGHTMAVDGGWVARGVKAK
ncbi:MAG TPA: hypothetical protein PK736_02245 [Bacteroidia bacterium]|nr:hypothetical protein [Bacteroidia bacterium]